MTTFQTSKYEQAQTLLRELLDEHDPEKTFSRHLNLNRRKNGRGLCTYPWQGEKGKITISKYLLGDEWPSIEETIRHEVAHVISGSKAGHGWEWKKACKLTGSKGERCGAKMLAQETIGRYETSCPSCGVIGHRHRLVATVKRSIVQGRRTCNKCHSKVSIVDTKTGERFEPAPKPTAMTFGETC
jgi:predicted SprT family Zn-dependent metalloprotease